MVVARRRTITLAEFLALPEEEPALEYFDGTVTQKMSPKGRHGTLEWSTAQVVNLYGIPRKLAQAFPETRTTFAGASYVPDVSVYVWGRIPTDDQGYVLDDFVTAPDIAVEIASPGQGRQKLLDRCQWYVQNGVRVALLIDPRRFTVTELRPDAESRVYRRGQKIELRRRGRWLLAQPGRAVRGTANPLIVASSGDLSAGPSPNARACQWLVHASSTHHEWSDGGVWTNRPGAIVCSLQRSLASLRMT